MSVRRFLAASALACAIGALSSGAAMHLRHGASADSAENVGGVALLMHGTSAGDVAECFDMGGDPVFVDAATLLCEDIDD